MSATRDSYERSRGDIFPNEFHDLLDVFNWRARNDSVAQVEDVARTACGLGEDLVHALSDQLRLGEEGNGVEVALHRAGMVKGLPALVERYAPVEAENI